MGSCGWNALFVSASVACSAPVSYDGTTGTACKTDSDCTSPGGPGIARCSNSVFAPDDYYPTAVCVLPTCSPVTDSTVHYCDGPDEQGSPGVCILSGSTGVCYPVCYYDTKGDPPTGCQGKDTCNPYSPPGNGYCWGGCTRDSDCQGGQHCETERGLCLADVVPPTKATGEACTEADEEAGACNCHFGGESEAGYCESFCIVGDDSTCPDGFVCGADESILVGYSVQNRGMVGGCHWRCNGDDAGTGCPTGTNSWCSYEYAGGPYCVVP